MRFVPVVIAVYLLAGVSAPVGAAEPSNAQVVLDVLPGLPSSGATEGVDCEGFAPTEPSCIGSFTVPNVSQFGVRIATDPNVGYTGTIEVQLKGAVGQTTIVCDLLLTAECVFQQVGPYFVGENVTLVAVASGFGSWIVQAPVAV